MKIYYIDNIKIIWKDINSYVIKSPLGNFDDINKAVEVFPNLITDKHVVKCVWCGGYFLRFGKKNNRQKTCSKECSKLYHIKKASDRVMSQYYSQKRISKQNIKDFIKENNGLPDGFNQDDTIYGLGESNLTENVAKNKETGEYDWEKELKVVQAEKRRLMNRQSPYTINLNED